MEAFMDFVPVAVVAFIMGVTFAVKNYVAPGDTPTPKWFLFVPLGLGFLAGLVHYFATAPAQEADVLALSKRIVLAVEMAFGYGGAAVILWELKKKFFDKKPEEVK